jgi:preprotein translocase SecE subunit
MNDLPYLVGFFIGDNMARSIKKTSKSASMREKAVQSRDKSAKPRRLKNAASTAFKPLHKVVKAGKKEIYLPLPDTKTGKFLNKRRSFMPKYFSESWRELRQVTWPNRKQTIQLTLAVFMFAVVFALFVAVVDYGLDKIFRKVLLS